MWLYFVMSDSLILNLLPLLWCCNVFHEPPSLSASFRPGRDKRCRLVRHKQSAPALCDETAATRSVPANRCAAPLPCVTPVVLPVTLFVTRDVVAHESPGVTPVGPQLPYTLEPCRVWA